MGTEKPSAYDALNPKQKAFVDAFLETGNATEASRKAGYKTRPNVQGARLIANASIRAALQERQGNEERERIASADEVLETVSNALRDKDADWKDRLKAAELLGRRFVLFPNRMEHSGPGGGAIEFKGELSTLSDEELDKREAELEEALRATRH